MLYMTIFDYVRSFRFTVKVFCVRSNYSVHPCILDDAVIRVLVKGYIFDFIGHGQTKNVIMLCGLQQDWFESVAVYNN